MQRRRSRRARREYIPRLPGIGRKYTEEEIHLNESIELMQLERQIRHEIYTLADTWVDSNVMTNEQFLTAILPYFIDACEKYQEHILIVCKNNCVRDLLFKSAIKMANCVVKGLSVTISMQSIIYIGDGYIEFASIYALREDTYEAVNFTHVVIIMDHLLYDNTCREIFLKYISPILLQEPCYNRQLWIKCYDRTFTCD